MKWTIWQYLLGINKVLIVIIAQVVKQSVMNGNLGLGVEQFHLGARILCNQYILAKL
jgi:hypothetical protein